MMYGMTSMQFEQFLDQLLNFGKLSALFQVPSFTLGIVAYVLTALALYTLAKRRGIDNAWFSWVPVLKLWIIGSLSDQYRYVVKGQIKSKRKVLVVLSIISMVLTVAIVIVSGMAVAQVAASVFTHVSEDVLLGRIVGLILTVCGFVIHFISSQNSISTVGLLIGLGAVCSAGMITVVLPSVLYVLDGFVLKLMLRKKKETE